MKRFLTSLLLLAGLASAGVADEAFTYESPAELAVALDADGDGRMDVLVVDKSTGVRQLGIQQSDGSFAWQDPLSTGLDRVTSLAAGHFTSNSLAQGFALASPDWNKSVLFVKVDADVAVLPTVGIGPNLVSAFPFTGGPGDDLVVATEWEDPPFPARLSGISLPDGTAALVDSPASETGALLQGNPARFRSDQNWMLAALRDTDDGRELVTRLYASGAGFASGPTWTDLSTNSAWAWGEFVPGGLSQFLFYAPGSSELLVAGIVEAAPSDFAFTAGNTFDLGQAIEQVQVLPQTNGAMLLVLFADGASAATYDFDGVQAPVQRQTLTPPAGMRLSLGAGIGQGDFLLLHSASGGKSNSTGWQRWHKNGARHSLASSGSLPPITPATARANVLLFDGNPDLLPGAPLLRSLKVGEWSLQASFVGPTLNVAQQTSQGAAAGLGGTTTVEVKSLSGLPSGVFAGVNQRAPIESAVFLGLPTVPPLEDLRFSPAPGGYTLANGGALVITIVSPSAAPIHFRTGPTEAWKIYDPKNPLQIRAGTTVTAYLELDPAQPIYTARYAIVDAAPIVPPGVVDANHNGIPDAWENAFGIVDPNGDPDGDGATNLQEYQAGTDPLDPLSKPSGNSGPIVLHVRAPGPDAPADALCEIVWPASATSAVLEANSDLGSASGWAPVAGPFVTQGDERIHYQSLLTAPAQRFFRLR